MKIFLRGYRYVHNDDDLSVTGKQVCVWSKQQIDRDQAILNAPLLKRQVKCDIISIEEDWSY